jgi:tellurite resistance-related uncharacterized protein
MKTIPAEMTHYKSTPVFTEETPCCAPAQSYDCRRHLGRITILEGSLLYRITDERYPSEEVLLTPSNFGVVEPQVKHEVAVVGPVRFQVDFHR